MARTPRHFCVHKVPVKTDWFLNASKEGRTVRNPTFESAAIDTLADSLQPELVELGSHAYISRCRWASHVLLNTLAPYEVEGM